MSVPPSFLAFLIERYSPDSPQALLDRVRLKALLFLSSSSKYDVEDAKKELEAMEVKGLKGLVLERAVVYGKVSLSFADFCRCCQHSHSGLPPYVSCTWIVKLSRCSCTAWATLLRPTPTACKRATHYRKPRYAHAPPSSACRSRVGDGELR